MIENPYIESIKYTNEEYLISVVRVNLNQKEKIRAL